ncbi:MAG: RNA polymerase sigma factor [Pseudomonas sp.]
MLARLFLHCRPSLNRYFLRRRAAAWEAEDLVQEVYLRLQRSQVPAERIENPEAYLFTIASNVLKEQALRRAPEQLGSASLDTLEVELAVPLEAEHALDAQQRSERLAGLMQRLPPRCRAVMVLRYRDELEYRQIAERLQISVPMVKKHLARGTALCRQGMAGYG